jgi:anti-sigma factor RsiW
VIHCSESERLQSLLDGELSAVEESALRLHVVGCEACTADLALYQRLFTLLASMAVLAPRPALTERILDRVLPSRIRRRWMRALGWGYGLATTGSVAGVALLLTLPTSRAFFAALAAAASHRIAEAAMFVLDALAFAAVQLASGWGMIDMLVERIAPIARAIGSLFARPGVDLVLVTATVASALLLWWLRPRELRASRASRGQEIGHVGLLGF